MFFLFKLTSATVINELLLLCGVPQGLILGSLVSFHRVPPGPAALNSTHLLTLEAFVLTLPTAQSRIVLDEVIL